MSSVTQRIKEIKQPYGGYIKPSEFEKIEFDDNYELGEENIHSSLVGLVVDYMTRYIMGTPVEEAFKIPLMGSQIINDDKYSYELINKIKGFDDDSIYNACKLVGYDVCYRVGPMGYKDVRTIDADNSTIKNIQIMIGRSLKFFEKFGPIVKDGFTFEGGYTNIINSGDGDFLTKDTLWDFKVSSALPKSSHTLQLLIYYLMGKKSIHSEFDSIKKLGIFNPRLNCVFLKDVDQIPEEIIETVSNEVIGYNSQNKNIVSNDVVGINSQNKNTISSDELTLTEVMRELQCTRYMVMKYYSEKGLPLKKINNKYYINRRELYEWILEMEEERKRQMRITIITLLVGVLVFAIIFGLLFSKV